MTLAVFAPVALLVPALGGGLTALWWAMALMMTVRMLTLWLRTRSGRWIVTGADALTASRWTRDPPVSRETSGRRRRVDAGTRT